MDLEKLHIFLDSGYVILHFFVLSFHQMGCDIIECTNTLCKQYRQYRKDSPEYLRCCTDVRKGR